MPIKLITGGTKFQRLKRDRAFYAKEERRLELERRDRIVQRSIERQAREAEERESSKGVSEHKVKVTELLKGLSSGELNKTIPQKLISDNEALLRRANLLGKLRTYLDSEKLRNRIKTEIDVGFDKGLFDQDSDPNEIVRVAVDSVSKKSKARVCKDIASAKDLLSGFYFPESK